MHPQKALGPDDMPLLFFQHFWSICGEVVTTTVLEFLNHGVSAPDFNKMHIVLIPKSRHLRRLLIIDLLVYVMWCTKLLQKP